ncbi:DUF4167 domain-containing protein [Sphingobium cloacae]|uniref:DUF4167 domain-containing protein n=1 Tax=Sphingobium cloacae TaxID=120107 RepID=A0A1E1F2Z6_9SPHN|nr:DUF4167 domain-containing protein [Sphingobium cloacae]BAV64894.1 hypothetical protein SCLO_1018540 [Sphingobium cloacae]
MINNRQAGRRNRGRNNGRPNNNSRGGGDNGNRIDNRARGNAAQLLEKYKNMARDAQMAGDRVNAEYYLQFADHYFRVLADNRARQEEQQQRFRRYDENFDGDGDEGDADDEAGEGARGEPQPYDRAESFQPRRRDDRRDDREGRERRDRNVRERPAQAQAETAERPAAAQAAPEEAPVAAAAPVAEPQAEEAPAPRRRGRPRKADAAKAAEEKVEGLDVAALPPSIARADNDSETPEEAPRKRGRRPRAATQAAE